MSSALLSAPRWVSGRCRGAIAKGEWYLIGPRSAYVVLDVRVLDWRRSRSRRRYTHRLLIGRVDPAAIPHDAQRIAWVWDKPRKNPRRTT